LVDSFKRCEPLLHAADVVVVVVVVAAAKAAAVEIFPQGGIQPSLPGPWIVPFKLETKRSAACYLQYGAGPFSEERDENENENSTLTFTSTFFLVQVTKKEYQ
jgi:hypothetical protein